MRSTLPFLNNGITLEKETHTYTGQEIDDIYTPVSTVLKKFSGFNRDYWSAMVARSRVGWKTATKDQIRLEQINVIAEWDEKARIASEHGTYVHDGLEQYIKTGSHNDDNIAKCGQEIYERWLMPYRRIHCEAILHLEQKKIAGTADLTLERPPAEKIITIDVGDYKTNIDKGIVYCNIKELPDKTFKYYESRFKAPLDHLEYCNYIEYSLQMSMYAYMLETQYGLNIGRLFIIFIDENFRPHYIPCAYMKFEVVAMLHTIPDSRILKQLPNTSSIGGIEDEW